MGGTSEEYVHKCSFGHDLKWSGENEASVALRNCKKIEKLEDPMGLVKEILKLCPARVLVALYKLPSFDSVDFLKKVATVRGKLKKGGIVDVESAARKSSCMTGMKVKSHTIRCLQLGIKKNSQNQKSFQNSERSSILTRFTAASIHLLGALNLSMM
ncbi:guanine nucleotide-binding protein-like NSN1 [Rhododendron vialii]|uniref:guanine nucleotide-binding protein-like NSN1 n=1 Tax=Rhododendron vialii TaxID=182163 RepID=UPI00265F1ACF|nr:guanine nucleotide-binding protein-like NSN1 [Rhododendron vialii]